MTADHHIHMVLDGENWREAIHRHSQTVDTDWVHRVLGAYRDKGYTYLRDGGDRWGVCAYARQVASEYGISYRIPFAPLSKAGHYGGFIGLQYADLKEYARQVADCRRQGADFIKIMISGLMDFDRYGVLSEPGMSPEEIRELIHIAHEEGFAVMAHANGADTVVAAATAGVDSVEHGAYLDEEALQAMRQAGTVWVPTLSTVGNLRGKGRFSETVVERIFADTVGKLRRFAQIGGLVAAGTDAGAWAVPHGCGTEEAYLAQAGITAEMLTRASKVLQQKF